MECSYVDIGGAMECSYVRRDCDLDSRYLVRKIKEQLGEDVFVQCDGSACKIVLNKMLTTEQTETLDKLVEDSRGSIFIPE